MSGAPGGGRGKLVLKGRGPIASFSSASAGVKRARDEQRPPQLPSRAPGGALPPEPLAAAAAVPEAPVAVIDPDAPLERTSGSGTLITSGSSVRGFGTRFLTEVRAGWVLEVAGDARPVRFIVGDEALALSEPFARDTGRQETYVIAAPAGSSAGAGATATPAATAAAVAAKHSLELAAATGTSSQFMQVKKTGGSGSGPKSYTVAPVRGGGATLSREELLDLRAKQRGDKFC